MSQEQEKNPHSGMPLGDIEGKIKAMHNFRTAVRSGTFAGAVSHHVAALLILLDGEHDSAVAEYESRTSKQAERANKSADKAPAGVGHS